MNSSVYIFQSGNSGYLQYPDDASHAIFQVQGNNIQAESQICVHREHGLSYYSYLRLLDNSMDNSYFGIGIVLNGVVTYDISLLFDMFEKLYEDVVKIGKILSLSKEGEVILVQNLSMVATEADRIAPLINDELTYGGYIYAEIPAVNNSEGQNEFHVFTYSGNNQSFHQAIDFHNNICIVKTRNIGTPVFNGIIQHIKDLNRELKEQKLYSDNLLSKIDELNNTRHKNPLMLFQTLVIIVLIIIFLYKYFVV